jgi:hypothetical protein
MSKRLLYTLSACLLLIALRAQNNTLGLLDYRPDRAYAGYTLIFPHNQPDVTLLDNCGEVVHQWTDAANIRPGNAAYLQPDGTLLVCKRDAVVADDPIWAGGGGEFIELRTWDNELLWSYELNDENARLHHDAIMLPSGNVLAIAWERKTREEAIAAGRDSTLLPEGELWPDMLLEIDTATSEIVWEWHAWDHLVQDFDPTQDNFGVVADHPERIDVNWFTDGGKADWMHANSVAYNADLRQILLSVPEFNEIWIIDHTTDTQEAASSFGGLGKRGGDLMYRWGNPQTYDRGTADDQQLFYQHDAQFITTPPTLLGSISLFNNRVTDTASQAATLFPPWEMYTWTYTLEPGAAWGPTELENVVTSPDPERALSTGLSSAQYLPNGNQLLCIGRYGYLVELTPNGQVAWEYLVPLRGGNAVAQGEDLAINQNLTFRATRYGADFPAFAERDLTPQGFLELEPNADFCDRLVDVTEPVLQSASVRLYPNPATNLVTLEWEGGRGGMPLVELLDLTGRVVWRQKASGGRCYLLLTELQSGL